MSKSKETEMFKIKVLGSLAIRIFLTFTEFFNSKIFVWLFLRVLMALVFFLFTSFINIRDLYLV